MEQEKCEFCSLNRTTEGFLSDSFGLGIYTKIILNILLLILEYALIGTDDLK